MNPESPKTALELETKFAQMELCSKLGELAIALRGHTSNVADDLFAATVRLGTALRAEIEEYKKQASEFDRLYRSDTSSGALHDGGYRSMLAWVEAVEKAAASANEQDLKT